MLLGALHIPLLLLLLVSPPTPQAPIALLLPLILTMDDMLFPVLLTLPALLLLLPALTLANGLWMLLTLKPAET
jgi:hypothetical protein